MLALVVGQKALAVAMQQRAGGDHLGVQQSVPGEQAQEKAAVAIGPVHHRSDTEASVNKILIYKAFCQIWKSVKSKRTDQRCTQSAHGVHVGGIIQVL
ncbi:hypothetical protein D3C81_1997290 [compost metagenome]